jgi:hypothetical protein
MGVSEPYEPGSEAAAQVAAAASTSASKVEEQTGGGGWFSGLAGSLRGSLSPSTRGGESRRGLPPAGTYKIGEVKAEYVKVCPSNASSEGSVGLTSRTRRDSIRYYHLSLMSPILESLTQERQSSIGLRKQIPKD